MPEPTSHARRFAAWLMVVIASIEGLSNACAADPSRNVQQAADSLSVREGFRFRAIASEPLVVDPVSARLDSRGRLWVVEMPDYPVGPGEGQQPDGRIKILKDVDQDGIFDQFDLFAEGLSFATGVQPYRDGAFVTLAGAIVFIRDQDGDNRGDEMQVLFQGFAEQNQQLRANHPTLGPDGLVYVANGLRGGAVVAVDPRFKASEEPVDLRSKDFAFDPEGGWWGAVAGNSQFGLSIDDFGRRIGCSNRNPAMTPGVKLAEIERNPLLASRDAILDIAAAAEKSKVVSSAEAWTTSNLHSGQFSAACGVLAPGRSKAGQDSMLVCEPTAYIVQRQNIERAGSVWRAKRESPSDEFISSTDTWFRPVDLSVGPASSVLVVDMARAVIEHPDFMPPELKSRPDQRDGDDLGRIWQIARDGNWPTITSLDNARQAVGWLESASPWQRQVASQFLLETDEDQSAALGSMLMSASSPAQGRARAAWILHRHRELTSEHLQSLMNAKDPRLRGLAISLSVDHADWLLKSLALRTDDDALVRRTVAARAGSGFDFAAERAAALAAIAGESATDEWIEKTIASIDRRLLLSVAEQMVERSPPPAGSSPGGTILQSLVQRSAIDSPRAAASIVIRFIRQQESLGESSIETAGLLEAWIAGCKRGRHGVAGGMNALSDSGRTIMQRAFQAAASRAVDASADPDDRARCIKMALETGTAPDDLKPLFSEQTPPGVRAVVLEPLLRSEPVWMREYLKRNLGGMSIKLRGVALAACGRRAADASWLMNVIASGAIPKTMIDPEMAKRLRQHPDANVARMAAELLRADPDRAKVLARYAKSFEKLGDPVVGKRLFAEQCAACHRIDGAGTNVGPDISDTRTKSAESLLTSIIDPNAAIDSSFVQFRVLSVDGRVFEGLLVDETSEAVTLQQKGGERVVVRRSDVERMQTSGASLMPEGFERTLDPKAMSDLVSYLKNWRYLKTEIPGTLRD